MSMMTQERHLGACLSYIFNAARKTISVYQQNQSAEGKYFHKVYGLLKRFLQKLALHFY